MANAAPQTSSPTGMGSGEQFDAIISGAGLTGLYQLYKLRQLGLSVRVHCRSSQWSHVLQHPVL